MPTDIVSTITERLPQLRDRVAQERRLAELRPGRFLSSLLPRLAGAAAIEAALAHRTANRFNVLDYVRKDELGLSRVIADLLDPAGPHGQKTLFLRAFLRLIDAASPAACLPDNDKLDECGIVVTRERPIETGEPDLEAPRRLDICVVFQLSGQDAVCLAIENKPYAGDGDNQVNAYHEWLTANYGGRFVLIYLSSHGGRPGYNSLPPDAPAERLVTMPYCPVPMVQSIDNPGTPPLPALTVWLAECAQVCDVDRLRWFLRDAETFCHKRFGETTTMPNELEEVRKFTLESSDNVRAALAVFESWPRIRNEIVARFLERLRDRIRDGLGTEPSATDDLQIDSSFAGVSSKDGIWACRARWWAPGDTRPYIWLGHDGPHPKSWYLGVVFDPRGRGSPVERQLQQRLAREPALRDGKHGTDWPWYRYLDEPYADWSPLAYRMHEEALEPGELMRDLSEQILAFAKTALPVIDGTMRDPAGQG